MSDDDYLLRKDRPRWWRLVPVNVWISVGSAVVAICSFVFSGLQYRVTNEQAKIAQAGLELAKKSAQAQTEDVERSRKAAERSAVAAEGNQKAAQSSAELAQAQLENTIRLFHVDQRARVDVDSVTRESEIEAGKPVRFRCAVRNIGKTHALGFTGQGWIAADQTFKPEYWVTNPIERSVKDLGPGGFSGFDTEITLPQSYVEAIKNKTTRIWVYGRATYKDVFDEKTTHQLKWCYFYPPPGDAAPTIRELSICEQHNSSN
jgi:hypothetical protein